MFVGWGGAGVLYQVLVAGRPVLASLRASRGVGQGRAVTWWPGWGSGGSPGAGGFLLCGCGVGGGVSSDGNDRPGPAFPGAPLSLLGWVVVSVVVTAALSGIAWWLFGGVVVVGVFVWPFALAAVAWWLRRRSAPLKALSCGRSQLWGRLGKQLLPPAVATQQNPGSIHSPPVESSVAASCRDRPHGTPRTVITPARGCSAAGPGFSRGGLVGAGLGLDDRPSAQARVEQAGQARGSGSA